MLVRINIPSKAEICPGVAGKPSMISQVRTETSGSRFELDWMTVLEFDIRMTEFLPLDLTD